MDRWLDKLPLEVQNALKWAFPTYNEAEINDWLAQLEQPKSDQIFSIYLQSQGLDKFVADRMNELSFRISQACIMAGVEYYKKKKDKC